MKIKEIILILSILVVSMLNTSSDFEEYKNLKNYNVAIIKKDIPQYKVSQMLERINLNCKSAIVVDFRRIL